MLQVLIIAEESEQIKELKSKLHENGFAISTMCSQGEAAEALIERIPDVALVDVGGSLARSEAWHQWCQLRPPQRVPTIILIPTAILPTLDFTSGIDDFVVKPLDPTEVISRIRQLLWRISNIDSGDILCCGNLVMDLDRCDVSLGGETVELTFTEYELLKFMMTNRGKVLSREILLDKVWGYDYYGGDRTVDVHIRRLRSKIEDSSHTFIETVRNIGYRFRKDA